MAANQRRSGFQAFERVLQIPMSDCGGADNERAVADCIGNGGEFFGSLQYLIRADSGARTFESDLVGIHQPQAENSKIAHGAGGSADVQGIADIHQDYAQSIEFRWRRQADLFYGKLYGRGLRKAFTAGAGRRNVLLATGFRKPLT
jgi:hypothetical protein